MCFDPIDNSGPKLCEIGMKGPGGGFIFFIDYENRYSEYDYLEAAPTDAGEATIVSATADADAIIYTTSTPHGFEVGQAIIIFGNDLNGSSLRLSKSITSVSEISFTVSGPDAVLSGTALLRVPFATTHAGCGPSLTENCQTSSIYTETLSALSITENRHRGLGGGKAATALIVKRHSEGPVDGQGGVPMVEPVPVRTYAAGLADSYVSPTFNGTTKADWYLPSLRELDLLYLTLVEGSAAVFASDYFGYYWSSSEVVFSRAWNHRFSIGTPEISSGKNDIWFVRPVRSF